METISQGAFLLSLVASAGATLAHWRQLLGVRLVVRRLATEAGAGPAVASVEPADSRSGAAVGRMGTALTWLVLLFLIASLGARWQAAGYAPWSNMYEFTVAFAAGITAFYAIFERWYWRRRAARAMGSIVLPVVLAMLIVAGLFFPAQIQPLVPALQNSDLLAVHVAAMVLAYGALSISFAAAVLYLVQGGRRHRFQRLPRAQLLDDIAYKSVMVGFPLLAVGIALGAYWANSAWGRYWGWDPKETSSLVTWLIYGIYLHAHGLRGWAGTRSAVILVLGFAAVLFTYFAVNLWVSGLHSYAGV